MGKGLRAGADGRGSFTGQGHIFIAGFVETQEERGRFVRSESPSPRSLSGCSDSIESTPEQLEVSSSSDHGPGESRACVGARATGQARH